MASDSSATHDGETASARLIRGGFDWMFRHWRGLGIAVVLAFVGLSALSGFYQVDVGETAALRRFGRLIDASIQPGLHWHVPFGIDQVDRFRTERVYRIEVEGQVDPEMSIFTGDVNLIDARFVVQYHVDNLKDFLFSSELPLEILSREIRSAFIDTVSSMFVDMVLATEKAYVEDSVLANAQKELERLDIGLQLISVNLVFVQPPVDAIPAFRAVNDAKAQKLEIVDAAIRRREQTLAQARGTAAHVVEKAKAGAVARVAQSESAAARFLALLDTKRIGSDQAETTLYWDSVRRFLGRARIVVLQPGESPDIGVNLLEGMALPPPWQADGKPGPEAAGDGLPGREPPHPGAIAAHATEDVDDRAPGDGGHETDSEVHHFGPVPDDTRRLPPHQLDPNVEVPQPPQPSHLGLPHADATPATATGKEDENKSDENESDESGDRNEKPKP